MENIVISLGWNCKPKTLKYEIFNQSLTAGYKTCPFDLCGTTYENLCKCISEDFDESKFFNLTVGPDKWLRNEYDMLFTHESEPNGEAWKSLGPPDFYVRDDFFEFKKRYKQRIINFKEYLKNDNILFLMINPIADPIIIRDIIKQMYPETKFHIALISDKNFQNDENAAYFYNSICTNPGFVLKIEDGGKYADIIADNITVIPAPIRYNLENAFKDFIV